ncbi:hypothetical protein K2173_022890 [Erythroxylum novogranatense]|uniref:DUF4378 domain-containing protein n=1 Tax=Erythroxylum novogranatense TaxID=1862640 RepID=A0AAV8TY61_9ROSI|nr:hypothetical protein K2173_022890 [Erythroxylum novogranatense]
MGIRPVMDGDANFKSDGDDENDLKPVTIVVDGKQFCGKETVEDTQTQEYMIERGSTENNHNSSCSRSDIDVGFPSKCKKHGDLIEIRKQEHISYQDQNVGSVNNNGIDEQTLFPNFETHYKDKIDKRELPILQGIDSNSSSSCIHERDSIANLQEKPVQYSVAQSCCTTSCVNMENANAWTYYHFLHLESNCCNNDFNYVRDVLEIAGFNEEDHFGRWYSLDQPLNPLVFKELEAYLHPELNTSEGYTCSCDHRLLFDLMNELLLEMYNSSLAYFPEPLSFIQRHISPLRNGGHALEEVWKRVSLLRRPQSPMDKSLDDIVGGDMENGDGWMNLILEGEDVALDLEDMIFEEVLDEIECI